MTDPIKRPWVSRADAKQQSAGSSDTSANPALGVRRTPVEPPDGHSRVEPSAAESSATALTQPQHLLDLFANDPISQDPVDSPWGPAKAVAPKPELGFPELSFDEEERRTRAMPLHELPVNYQVEKQMEIIRQHHPRIASGLDQMWGFEECAEYLNKLVFDGTDPHSHHRVGFKPPVLAALMRLQALHQVTAR